MRLAACLLLALALGGTAVAATPPPGLVTHGPRARRLIALTFDADMTRAMLARLRSGAVRSWYDARIVRELRATRTPATIFLTGLWAETYPGVVRSLARDPLFELENHSFDHSAFEGPCYGLTVLPTPARKRADVLAGAATIARIAGRRPRLFRFPGGCASGADVRLVRSLGELPVQWDVVSGDSFLRRPGEVEREVLNGARPGSVVVMHLIGAPDAPATAASVAALIPALEARGFRFVTLRTLLDQPGTSP